MQIPKTRLIRGEPARVRLRRTTGARRVKFQWARGIKVPLAGGIFVATQNVDAALTSYVFATDGRVRAVNACGLSEPTVAGAKCLTPFGDPLILSFMSNCSVPMLGWG
jgi:hypothetical protein